MPYVANQTTWLLMPLNLIFRNTVKRRDRLAFGNIKRTFVNVKSSNIIQISKISLSNNVLMLRVFKRRHKWEKTTSAYLITKTSAVCSSRGRVSGTFFLSFFSTGKGRAFHRLAFVSQSGLLSYSFMRWKVVRAFLAFSQSDSKASTSQFEILKTKTTLLHFKKNKAK